MWTRCLRCDRGYDDAACWTICPHGPLDVPLGQFCPVHDLARPYQPATFDFLGCPHLTEKCVQISDKNADESPT